MDCGLKNVKEESFRARRSAIYSSVSPNLRYAGVLLVLVANQLNVMTWTATNPSFVSGPGVLEGLRIEGLFDRHCVG